MERCWSVMCPICGGKSRQRFALGPYEIRRCTSCAFGWPDPLPTAKELLAYYADCHHPHAVEDDPVLPVKRARIAREMRALAPAARTFLDVGCGFGQQLDAARKYDFETHGVEIDKERASVATSKGHHICSSLDSYEREPCDVVVMDQVIEHLLDPVNMLRTVRTVLKAGGVLYIGCPNFGCFRAKIAGAHFAELTPPEHIAYFTENSLRVAARSAGFEDVRLRTRTIPVNVKNFLAYLCRMQFLRWPQYAYPKDRVPGSIPRFVDGRLRWLKAPLYKVIMATSRLLCPVVNAFGGDQIESVWRARGS
jgi:SAM-dependent methyltransferase